MHEGHKSNRIVVSFSQKLGDGNELRYEKVEHPKEKIEYLNCKVWVACLLNSWFKMNQLQRKKLFNLKMSIKIEIKVDDKSYYQFTQKRIDKKMAGNLINKIEKGQSTAGIVPFMLKNSYYIITEMPQDKKEKIVNRNSSTLTNPDIQFNTIEYLALKDMQKNYSPIIYTGMIN